MAVDKTFYLYLAAVLGNFSAMSGMFALVSSFNVDEGLGTWSLALGYGASLFAASFTPLIGYIIGCKRLLIFAEVGYLLFLVGNSITSYYTVLPAGFFLGISEAWAWTAMPIITTYFAHKRTSADPKSMEKHNRYYTGYFYSVVKAAMVTGNGLSFAILQIDKSMSQQYNETQTRSSDYSFCGANDCQIANVTQANMQQYEPAFPYTRYIIVALYSFLTICAILLHAICLPKDIHWELEDGTKVESAVSCNGESLVDLAEQHLFEGDVGVETSDNRPKKVDNENIDAPQPSHENLSRVRVLKTTLSATLKVAFKPKHMLIALLPIYTGMTMGYGVGELTRAYSSCMLGVEKVGICMMLYSSVDCIASLITGRIGGKYGRNIPFFIAFIVDLSLYAFSLTWQPDESNVWLVYVIFMLFGFSDGVWVTMITALYGEYFVNDHKVAYNLWNVVTNVGFLIQFSLSTTLCVYAKIYLQMSIMFLAVIAYGISQFIYYPHEVCKWRTTKSTASI